LGSGEEVKNAKGEALRFPLFPDVPPALGSLSSVALSSPETTV